MNLAALILFALAGVGLLLIGAQLASLRRHLRQPLPPTNSQPAISVLKPLCGVDDELFDNLRTFIDLDYPNYEILLGVKSVEDSAYPLARKAQALWPERVRVVLQSGAPGFNPKVNQLIGLVKRARHDILVVSDSNMRVARNYLREIAGHFQDSQVGLITHPIAGIGGRRLGARMDNLYLSSSIAPGVIAAKRLTGKDFVVAKSMALRRADLYAMGGFEAVKDVLAEDYVTGRRVLEKLGKRIVVAATPIFDVSCHRSAKDFVSRYARWSVMQRQAVGTPIYTSQVLLNPLFLAGLGALISYRRAGLLVWAICCLLKMALDTSAARLMLKERFSWQCAWAVPPKDLLVAAFWICGLLSNKVNWRGNRFLVLKGTRLVPAGSLAGPENPDYPSIATPGSIPYRSFS
jgi:ceramide glucosyltransferase